MKQINEINTSVWIKPEFQLLSSINTSNVDCNIKINNNTNDGNNTSCAFTGS
jgi:hypothetical protein